MTDFVETALVEDGVVDFVEAALVEDGESVRLGQTLLKLHWCKMD